MALASRTPIIKINNKQISKQRKEVHSLSSGYHGIYDQFQHLQITSRERERRHLTIIQLSFKAVVSLAHFQGWRRDSIWNISTYPEACLSPSREYLS